MKKSELLEDYCQSCGATVGSMDCCQNRPKTRKLADVFPPVKKKKNKHKKLKPIKIK